MGVRFVLRRPMLKTAAEIDAWPPVFVVPCRAFSFSISGGCYLVRAEPFLLAACYAELFIQSDSNAIAVVFTGQVATLLFPFGHLPGEPRLIAYFGLGYPFLKVRKIKLEMFDELAWRPSTSHCIECRLFGSIWPEPGHARAVVNTSPSKPG